MKLRNWILLLVAVACILGCIVSAANPLRKETREIRAELLGKTPLGSLVHDVEVMISHEGWKEAGHRKLNPKDRFYPQEAKVFEEEFPGLKVAETIHAELGSYQGIPWATIVHAEWGFDSDGKLVGISVFKAEDSI